MALVLRQNNLWAICETCSVDFWSWAFPTSFSSNICKSFKANCHSAPVPQALIAALKLTWVPLVPREQVLGVPIPYFLPAPTPPGKNTSRVEWWSHDITSKWSGFSCWRYPMAVSNLVNQTMIQIASISPLFCSHPYLPWGCCCIGSYSVTRHREEQI